MLLDASNCNKENKEINTEQVKAEAYYILLCENKYNEIITLFLAIEKGNWDLTLFALHGFSLNK